MDSERRIRLIDTANAEECIKRFAPRTGEYFLKAFYEVAQRENLQGVAYYDLEDGITEYAILGGLERKRIVEVRIIGGQYFTMMGDFTGIGLELDDNKVELTSPHSFAERNYGATIGPKWILGLFEVEVKVKDPSLRSIANSLAMKVERYYGSKTA